MVEKINYQKKLEDLVSTFSHKPSLLLHSCCGPCSTQVIDFLKDYFDITIFYYNPNIEPREEYELRKKEQLKFLREYKKAKILFLDCDYANNEFKDQVDGIMQEKEGGARCHKCYYIRMKETAKVAKQKGFEYFGTTLTVSPYKNSQVINKIGEHISQELSMPYIYGDFKKNDGYKKSIEFSKIYSLYRQNYCGCLYGKGSTYD